MLAVVFLVLVLFAQDFVSAGISVQYQDSDKELVLAFVVNRHGERTPAEEEAALSKDVVLIKNLTYIEGYEGLTNEGKRRAYQIGKFIKERYGMLHPILSSNYLQQEISIRSTDKERTKMTAQIAMSAVYPPGGAQVWGAGLGSIWQPVPYTTVPLAEDYLRFYSNCDYYKTLLEQAKVESLSEEFAPYLDLVDMLYEETGANFTENPILFQTLHDLFNGQLSLGLKLPDWAVQHYDRLTEAATLAYRLYFRTEEMKKISAGVMLNNFLTKAEAIINGSDTERKLYLYSSHDFNLGGLMAVSQVADSIKTLPSFGAVLALELYKLRNEEEYYVLPVYVPQAGSSQSVHRDINGCEEFCDFEIFSNITNYYRLRERDFYTLCNIRTEL